jgi:glycosyltransferase involved in cell wall biosynthesis
LRPDVSVIIPMHNAAATVERLVGSLLAIDDVGVEVVVVDDASTDGSPGRVASLGGDAVVLERFDVNRGAGVARNRGFAVATGRYSLFFDADDEIHPTALAAAVQALDDTGADVAVMPYRYRRGHGSNEGMNVFDAAAWGRYATSPRRLTRLSDVPQLLGFSSYPWNKVLRTDHYRKAQLRFSGTPVHNDILGHWLTLLDAEGLLLIDQPLCTHIVSTGGRNLTNRESRARLSLVDALDETYTELERRPEKRSRYAHHYWDFVLRVGAWASTRLTPDVVGELDVRLQRHLLRMDLGDFTRMRVRRDPVLAHRIVRRASA